MIGRTTHPNYEVPKEEREAIAAELRAMANEPVKKVCWNCGGSGVRCCEYGSDR